MCPCCPHLDCFFRGDNYLAIGGALGTDDGVAAIGVRDVSIAVVSHSSDDIATCLLIVAASANDYVTVNSANFACSMGEFGVVVIRSMASIFEFFKSCEICGAWVIVL